MPNPNNDNDQSSVVPQGGYRAMTPKPDAQTYTPAAEVAAMNLPKKVDLRRYMTPVENQGQTSSCVANAVAGAYEYSVKRALKKDYDVSRLYVYYNARWRNKDQDKDAGSYIQYAIEGLQKFGACPEKTWPFKKEILFAKPNQTSYKEGSEGKVEDARKMPLKLELWKQALAEGLPIVFGCVLFDSFDQCKTNGGVVVMPDPDEVTRSSHGAHSMLVVGYSDVEEVFIVRNSWGSDWADKGYCYIPYNYLINDKFNLGDCWVFTPPNPILPDDDVYFNDDRPVVNRGRGVNFKINPYSPDAYSVVTISLFATIGVVEWSSVMSESYQEYVESVSTENWSRLEEYSVKEWISEHYESSSSEYSETTESSFVSTDVSETSFQSETTDTEADEVDDVADEEDEAEADDVEDEADTEEGEDDDAEAVEEGSADEDDGAEEEEATDDESVDDEEESEDGEETEKDEETEDGDSEDEEEESDEDGEDSEDEEEEDETEDEEEADEEEADEEEADEEEEEGDDSEEDEEDDGGGDDDEGGDDEE